MWALIKIQEDQSVFVRGIGDMHVIALMQENAKTAIQIFFFRKGSNYGNRTYFPSYRLTRAKKLF